MKSAQLKTGLLCISCFVATALLAQDTSRKPKTDTSKWPKRDTTSMHMQNTIKANHDKLYAALLTLNENIVAAKSETEYEALNEPFAKLVS